MAGVQLGAGVLSAAAAVSSSQSQMQDAALAGGGVGLSLADVTKTDSFGKIPAQYTSILNKFSVGLIPKELGVIPVLGNLASLYSAAQDWNKMWDSYNNCMEHY